jgi:hypothetical protein
MVWKYGSWPKPRPSLGRAAVMGHGSIHPVHGPNGSTSGWVMSRFGFWRIVLESSLKGIAVPSSSGA